MRATTSVLLPADRVDEIRQVIATFGEEGDVTPPDSTGAIGPEDYVEFANSEIAAYARADLKRVGEAKDIRSLYTRGATLTEIAQLYDTTAPTVARRLRELGVEIRPRGRPRVNLPLPPRE